MRMREECERLVLISENRQRKVKYGDGRQGIIYPGFAKKAEYD